MIDADAARPTEHPDALDYILRGRAALLKPATRATRGEAIAMFERALELDPQSVTAESWLARTLATRSTDQLSDSPAADIARGEGLVGTALAASPRSALARYARATVLRAQDRFEEAIPRLRDGNRLGSQLARCTRQSRSVQVLRRVAGGVYPDGRASHPPQSS